MKGGRPVLKRKDNSEGTDINKENSAHIKKNARSSEDNIRTPAVIKTSSRVSTASSNKKKNAEDEDSEEFCV